MESLGYEKPVQLIHNSINIDYESNNIVRIYDLFKTKLSEVIHYLNKQGIDLDEWNISYVETKTKENMEKMRDEVFSAKQLDWKLFINMNLKNLLDNDKSAFDIMKMISSDEQEKFERYYDLLCNFSGNLREYISIKRKEFNENEVKSLNDTSEIIYDSNEIEDSDVTYKYKVPYTRTLKNKNGEKCDGRNAYYKLAA